MKKLNSLKRFLLLSLAAITIISCGDDDSDSNSTLSLSISGLEDLGDDYAYEGWLIVDGSPVTTGLFDVNLAGELSTNTFVVDADDLSSATKFVLTIEPSPDPDPAPSSTHILAGDFSANSAELTIAAPEALGADFASSTGTYLLATPSDGAMNNEKSGVWFLGGLPPSPGLNLPALPDGWLYEGWAVIDGSPITTGTFTGSSGADNFSGFSGSLGTPPYPGEDFLENAPAGFSFPTDLSGGSVVISIEPSPDNSPAPFLLKPLLGDIPEDAAAETVYSLNNIIASNAPLGTASR